MKGRYYYVKSGLTDNPMVWADGKLWNVYRGKKTSLFISYREAYYALKSLEKEIGERGKGWGIDDCEIIRVEII